MTKTKKKMSLIMLLFCFFAISFSMFFVSPTKAFAATPQYKLQYDYSASCNGINQLSGTGYDYAPKISATSNKALIFYLTGPTSDGTAATAPKGTVFNFSTLYITSSLSMTSFSISGPTSKSGAGTSWDGTYSDGNYTFSGVYKWERTQRGVTTTWKYNISGSFSVDTTGPSITGASTTKGQTVVNSNTYISSSDVVSGVSSLYVKSPGDSDFSRLGTDNFTITTSMPNGVYEFYATDNANNSSVKHYVTLDTTGPTGTIKNSSNTIINGNYVNTDFYYTATDSLAGVKYYEYKTPTSSNWQTYTGGSIISTNFANGTYQFKSIDNAGNVSDIRQIVLDTAVPTGSIMTSDNKALTGSNTNGAFKYMATDSLSGISKVEYCVPGSSTWTTYSNGTIIPATATNGLYKFRAIDNAGNVSSEKSINLDTSLPIGTIKDENGKTVTKNYINGAFSYSATCSGSGIAYLEYMRPNDSTWQTYLSGTLISTTTNGLYHFRAVSNSGNISNVSAIYLDTEKPTGVLENSSGSGISSTTNQSFKYSAKDNGSGVAYVQYKTPNSSTWETFTNGTLITTTQTNGIYYFKCVDNAGNESSTVMIVFDTTKPTGTLFGGELEVGNNGKTNASYICFVANDSLSGVKNIYVKKPNTGSYVSYISGSQFAEEGTYYFYATDSAGNSSQTYSITLDKTAPTIGCLETEMYSIYGLGFTVSVSDNDGTAKLYYKTPSSQQFELAGTTSYSTNFDSENGKYYFYGIDDLGNKTAIYWIDLEIQYPDPIIVPYGGSGQVYVTWTNGTGAKLNGSDYVKETVIESEGEYTITIINEYGLETTKEFSILHNYTISKVVPVSCLEDGYTIYTCLICGDSYKANIIPATGHNYEEEVVDATCTTYGCIRYTCKNCGDSYETNVTTALGHKYTEMTKEVTCTENGGQLHHCIVCGYEYLTDIVTATGHAYATEVLIAPHCETCGERHFHCEKCDDEYFKEIPCTGHTMELRDTTTENGRTIRTYVCTTCGKTEVQDMGEQYVKIVDYIDYLMEQYEPIMVWVLLATAGVWSIVMGVFFAIAQKNEDKEKARKMIKNYIIGIVVIFCIVVACPYLVKGIAALISG